VHRYFNRWSVSPDEWKILSREDWSSIPGCVPQHLLNERFKNDQTKSITRVSEYRRAKEGARGRVQSRYCPCSRGETPVSRAAAAVLHITILNYLPKRVRPNAHRVSFKKRLVIQRVLMGEPYRDTDHYSKKSRTKITFL